MEFRALIECFPKWLDGSGDFAGIVLSSRIRLARNIEGIPFPHWFSPSQAREVLRLIENQVKENVFLKEAISLSLNNLSTVERQFLLERHLISPEYASGEKNYRAVVFTRDEVISMMINEEDHIRLQAIFSGLQLKEAWKLIDQIDTSLSRSLDYAYADDIGYLTACPSNVGTGMRASVLMHLPGLVRTNGIKGVLKAIFRSGMIVRGFYGEGTRSQASFFQISNEATLGLSELEIIQNLDFACRQIVQKEEEARVYLLRERAQKIKQEVIQSYEKLKNEYIISSREAMNLLSNIRLGLWFGFIPDIKISLLNELLVFTGPAHIQIMEGKRMDAFSRDVKRAVFLKKKIRDVSADSISSCAGRKEL